MSFLLPNHATYYYSILTITLVALILGSSLTQVTNCYLFSTILWSFYYSLTHHLYALFGLKSSSIISIISALFHNILSYKFIVFSFMFFWLFFSRYSTYHSCYSYRRMTHCRISVCETSFDCMFLEN